MELSLEPGNGMLTSDTDPFRVIGPEWRRVALWSLVILSLTSLPVVIGYLMPNDSYLFTGAAHNLE